jgi:hemerythrin
MATPLPLKKDASSIGMRTNPHPPPSGAPAATRVGKINSSKKTYAPALHLSLMQRKRRSIAARIPSSHPCGKTRNAGSFREISFRFGAVYADWLLNPAVLQRRGEGREPPPDAMARFGRNRVSLDVAWCFTDLSAPAAAELAALSKRKTSGREAVPYRRGGLGMEVGRESPKKAEIERYSVTSMLRWGEDFSVGIPVLDQQHRAIFDLLAQAHELWRSGAGVAQLRPLLSRLGELLGSHFAEEERVLEDGRFPRLAEHAAEHRSALDEQSAIARRFDAGPDGGGLMPGWVVFEFLLRVAVIHVLSSDAEYARYFVESPKGAAGNPVG